MEISDGGANSLWEVSMIHNVLSLLYLENRDIGLHCNRILVSSPLIAQVSI